MDRSRRPFASWVGPFAVSIDTFLHMRPIRIIRVLFCLATGMLLAVSGCGKSTTGSSTDGGARLDAPASTGGSFGGSGGKATGGAGGAGGTLTGGNGGTTAGGAGGGDALEAPAAGGSPGRTGGAGGSSTGSGGAGGSTTLGAGGNPGTGGSAATGGTKGTGGVASTGGIPGTGGTSDVCAGWASNCHPFCNGLDCACYCEGGTGGARSTGGGTGTGGTSGTGGVTGTGGTSARIDGGLSACQIIDALDRSCTVDADCVAVAHTSNCCGQLRYIGIRATEKDQFAANEPSCDASYPACGCAARSPTMDDQSADNRQTVQAGVTCLLGTCTTFVRDCGKPCASGTTCFSCSNHAQLFAACTTQCADTSSSSDCPSTALPLCQSGSSGNTNGTFCTAAGVACDTK